MQNVLSVLWSADNKYLLSGSDEMNIRLWKANASEKLGPVRFINFIKISSLTTIFLVKTKRKTSVELRKSSS